MILLVALGFLAQASPQQRAVAYLETEVPKWKNDHHCYSRHNNGDAARALFAAGSRAAVADTAAWLAQPERWELNRGHPAGSDRRLALAQYTVALSAAVKAGSAPLSALRTAAARLVADQLPDGRWTADTAADQLGSPVTWGTPLLTYLAAEAAGHGGQTAAAAKAGRWLSVFTPKGNLEFAVAILAGRPRFIPTLTAAQNSDGGWPETTRPGGGQSYAQHISTCAWATLALLATR